MTDNFNSKTELIRFWWRIIFLFFIVIVIMRTFLKIGEGIATAITLLALVVALFKEWIIDRYILRPKLEIKISSGPLHLQEAVAKNELYSENQAWLGLTVTNRGVGNARNLRVYFKGGKSNIIQEGLKSYRSPPLKVGWVDDTFIHVLPKNLETRWDICMVSSSNKKFLNFVFAHTPNKLTWLYCVFSRTKASKC